MGIRLTDQADKSSDIGSKLQLSLLLVFHYIVGTNEGLTGSFAG